MKRTIVIAITGALAAFIIISWPTQAQKLPPHIFVGTATIHGDFAPIGTPIYAMIEDQVMGKALVKEGGKYGIKVDQGEGRLIWFILGTRVPIQRAVWEQGGGTIMDITVKKCNNQGNQGKEKKQ